VSIRHNSAEFTPILGRFSWSKGLYHKALLQLDCSTVDGVMRMMQKHTPVLTIYATTSNLRL